MPDTVLHHKLSGEGEPLILLHGLFGMGDNLASIARPLSEYFTVYQLDLRNHGRSFWADSMRFEDMAADVLAFMGKKGLGQVHLLGHSLGGKVAMQVALMAPGRVASLVVADIAPVYYDGNHNEVFAGINAIDLHRLASRQDAEHILQQHIEEDGVRLFLLKSLYKNEAGQFDWRLNTAAIERCYDDIRQALTSDKPFNGPTLFIKGELSAYIQSNHREAIESLFPQAQLKVIQNAGHWLHAEKPVAFNNVVKQFLLNKTRHPHAGGGPEL
ncbi:MAG: alpha/beta fold hydrolase [Oceanicoccus sp.]|uniref:alpha/beta fold hydrolase n=1 Tax=Oceanicoccus sp. TaxID=2691044 RepID=UPI0026244427|nr:alpha/beta fold hydrolase [Oceanicoccus sp.]MCP3906629.1 alpha/beta fold hydrolase [Oceanicoccus sp.]MDG1773759.1 alpha/beta fold hydrolase [Oceanicoccus sp.]